MPDNAAAQATRLIELIAWLSQRDSREPVSYARAAARFGVSPATLRGDLGVLFSLTEEFKPWLASVSVGVQADGFTIKSRGPYRRPFRLTPDEILALAVGLAGVPRGTGLASRLLSMMGRRHASADVERRYVLGPAPSTHVESVLAQARQARDERRKVAAVYCGGSGEPVRRTVLPHQVLTSRATWYVYSWCETASGWRLFRVERFLEMTMLDDRFDRRPDFRPIEASHELLRADATIPTLVRFDAAISRWIRERYPNGQHTSDGSIEVTFQVADPGWLVREVLQYGDRAEVVAPESMREAVRQWVS